ncbi:MAG: flagellar biosynthesis protein FlgL [Sulfuricurvum sp.]|nr:flagellar biosynthesis protein FlgL [Sulfuricurvum sp.]
MRITSTSYYNNIYGENNKLNQQLFDVNKQIASGQKIQYAHENPNIFIDTLRLDDEITTLTQTRDSAQSAFKMSTQTDTTIGDMVKALESMKVKLINAANDTQSDSSIQAIAQELRGLKNNLLTLANTSIGGQFLFSGTETAQKPIDENGLYQGNNKSLEAFLGSGIKQKYNITGSQLFLGEESQINRTITTNLPQLNLTGVYGTSNETYITPSSTIGDLMGNTAATNATSTSHFYIQGSRSNGETFKTKISLDPTDTVDDLLKGISTAYGSNQVDVTLNANGQIEIVDKKTGSSKLDFHMVGAIDFDTAGTDTANITTNIDDLQAGTTDFQDIISSTNLLYIKEFTKSGFDPSNPLNTFEGIEYDRTNFEVAGAKLLSNVSQIVKADNSYAVPSTKLLDVAGVSTLIGEQLNIQGKNTSGQAIDLQINFGASSSVSGTVNGVAITPFAIYDASGIATNANNVTYQQLLDVVNMGLTNSLPTANTAVAYNTALGNADTNASTTLDYAGRIVFEDKSNPITQARVGIYDSSSSDYTVTNGSSLTFNANNTLTIRDPKTDFFTQIEEIIRAVEENKKRADGSDPTDPRNIGIQNAIQIIDDLSDHVGRLQTQSGSYSQVLQASSDRSDLLIVSTKMLQSDVIDTDVAEATLRMQQLSLNYQAMLSSISKVSQLSLVNYL